MNIDLLGSKSIREEKDKSRLQSAWDFFEALQMEHLCCILRSEIYSSKKDKVYWTRVANQKKITIEEISALNGGWPSIFDDPSKYKEYRGKLLNLKGLPNFIYKNREDSNVQGVQDQINWWSVGKTVNIDLGDGNPEPALIINYIPYRTNGLKVKLSRNGEEMDISESIATRVMN